MHKYAILEIKYDKNYLSIEDHKGYESRHASMIKLIHEAWDKHVKNSNLLGERNISLYTDDIFNPSCDYSFAIPGQEFLYKCMPNYVYDSWPECGIFDYQKTFDLMVSASLNEPVDDRVFWIGAISHLLNPAPRIMGSEVSIENPDLFDFRIIEWKNRGLDQTQHTSGYVTLVDHCKYRVLIDFGGAGFSARIPLLLASGRPVILVGHPQEVWFYWNGSLIPWKHYIPCGSKDGKNLSKSEIKNAILWTFENKEKAKSIGLEGQDYAKNNLNKNYIIDLIGSILINHPLK